ncbi:MAG: hypothetical protein E6J46_07740 [Chloroflexi bacterium]|nr:MAG: hypothetical protein E6J46_07740 [Chloroflexota bacterium]
MEDDRVLELVLRVTEPLVETLHLIRRHIFRFCSAAYVPCVMNPARSPQQPREGLVRALLHPSIDPFEVGRTQRDGVDEELAACPVTCRPQRRLNRGPVERRG